MNAGFENLVRNAYVHTDGTISIDSILLFQLLKEYGDAKDEFKALKKHAEKVVGAVLSFSPHRDRIGTAITELSNFLIAHDLKNCQSSQQNDIMENRA